MFYYIQRTKDMIVLDTSDCTIEVYHDSLMTPALSALDKLDSQRVMSFDSQSDEIVTFADGSIALVTLMHLLIPFENKFLFRWLCISDRCIFAHRDFEVYFDREYPLDILYKSTVIPTVGSDRFMRCEVYTKKYKNLGMFVETKGKILRKPKMGTWFQSDIYISRDDLTVKKYNLVLDKPDLSFVRKLLLY